MSEDKRISTQAGDPRAKNESVAGDSIHDQSKANENRSQVLGSTFPEEPEFLRIAAQQDIANGAVVIDRDAAQARAQASEARNAERRAADAADDAAKQATWEHYLILSLGTLIEEVTTSYLATLDRAKPLERIRDELLSATNAALIKRNEEFLGVNEKHRTYDVANALRYSVFQPMQRLAEVQVARVFLALRTVRRLAMDGLHQLPDFDLLGVYEPTGLNAGTYSTDTSIVKGFAKTMCPGAGRDMPLLVLDEIRELAQRAVPTNDPALIAVGNGVFDWEAQELRPYDTEQHVFVSKIRTDYVAQRPGEDPAGPAMKLPDGRVLTMDSWLHTLFEGLDDADDMVTLMWESMGAAFRPTHRWKKALFFHSPFGNSGKGSVLELVQNVYGENNPLLASMDLSAFGDRFGLVKLLKATLALGHENSVGQFNQNNGAFKAAVTHDPLSIERKGIDAQDYTWRGFTIQCMNSFARTEDKSGSFHRRQLWVPFPQSFEGREVPEIKEVFFHREDVKQYVLRRALMMRHTALSEPESCAKLKAEAALDNDPVVEFWHEHRDQFAWDLLPFAFLYDLYKAWGAKTGGGRKPLSQRTFVDRLLEATRKDPDWEYQDRRLQIRCGARMDAFEALVDEHELLDWAEPSHGVPVNQRSGITRPVGAALGKTNYRGLLRRDVPGGVAVATDRLGIVVDSSADAPAPGQAPADSVVPAEQSAAPASAAAAALAATPGATSTPAGSAPPAPGARSSTTGPPAGPECRAHGSEGPFPDQERPDVAPVASADQEAKGALRARLMAQLAALDD